MHTGKELEVEKGRLSCDSDAPQVGSARSNSTKVVKVIAVMYVYIYIHIHITPTYVHYIHT